MRSTSATLTATGCEADNINMLFCLQHDKMAVGYTCELWCEPGRALAAEAESVIVKVDARRKDTLYINDGAFGTLYDAAHCKWVFPTRAFSAEGEPVNCRAVKTFDFYGPTCDSADYLPGPFLLPDRIGEGDYIEVGNIGAYGRVMASQFNGSGYYDEVILQDERMMSMYAEGPGEQAIFNRCSMAAPAAMLQHR